MSPRTKASLTRFGKVLVFALAPYVPVLLVSGEKVLPAAFVPPIAATIAAIEKAYHWKPPPDYSPAIPIPTALYPSPGVQASTTLHAPTAPPVAGPSP